MATEMKLFDSFGFPCKIIIEKCDELQLNQESFNKLPKNIKELFNYSTNSIINLDGTIDILYSPIKYPNLENYKRIMEAIDNLDK